MDYSRASARSSANNLASLVEATNAVSNYKSMPASGAASRTASNNNLAGMGGDLSVGVSSLFPDPIIAVVETSVGVSSLFPDSTVAVVDREVADKTMVGGDLMTVPSHEGTAIDGNNTSNTTNNTTSNNNSNNTTTTSSNVRRKGSVNSGAAGILGVLAADLDNHNHNNDSIKDNNNLIRKSSVVSSVVGLLGGGRVVPVDASTAATPQSHIDPSSRR